MFFRSDLRHNAPILNETSNNYTMCKRLDYLQCAAFMILSVFYVYPIVCTKSFFLTTTCYLFQKLKCNISLHYHKNFHAKQQRSRVMQNNKDRVSGHTSGITTRSQKDKVKFVLFTVFFIFCSLYLLLSIFQFLSCSNVSIIVMSILWKKLLQKEQKFVHIPF